MIFDTSAVIDFLRGGSRTRSIVEATEAKGGAIALTTVSLFELLTPLYAGDHRKEERAVRSFVRQTTILSLDTGAAEEASKIMGRLRRIGRPVNALDALISGIAISNNADGMVTRDNDFREIAKVADLTVDFL